MKRNRFSALTTAASIATALNLKDYQVVLSASNTIDVSVFNDGSAEQQDEVLCILSSYFIDGDKIEANESNGCYWHTIYISFVK